LGNQSEEPLLCPVVSDTRGHRLPLTGDLPRLHAQCNAGVNQVALEQQLLLRHLFGVSRPPVFDVFPVQGARALDVADSYDTDVVTALGVGFDAEALAVAGLPGWKSEGPLITSAGH